MGDEAESRLVIVWAGARIGAVPRPVKAPTGTRGAARCYTAVATITTSEEKKMRRILILSVAVGGLHRGGCRYAQGFDAYTSGNFKSAIEEFRKSAQEGDALAMFYRGESYYNGRGVVQDFAEGIKWYKQSAEKGQVETQETLGSLYFFGKGVAQDYAEAAKWYAMAAKQGKVYPQYLLGYRYDQGKGLARDQAQAAQWFRKAAEQGHADAQESLAS
jgi:hypothetical protein